MSNAPSRKARRRGGRGAGAAARETAVIVGAGPGLGLALANAFAREGYTVLAAARGAGIRGLELVEAPGRVLPVRCDATKPENLDALFARSAEHGQLAVAVFNAGTFERRTVLETTPDDFERCWRIGCHAGFLVGRAAARRMMERGSGTILFTGATASLRGAAEFVNLASPKFGLRAVAQSMARELGPLGVHVAHVVIDGMIRTPRSARVAANAGPDALLEPDAIAAAYVALHRQPRSAWTAELDLRPWVERF